MAETNPFYETVLREAHQDLPFQAGLQGEKEAVASTPLRYEDISLVLRYTRRWIHYGMIAHILICTLIAAVEGVVLRWFHFS